MSTKTTNIFINDEPVFISELSITTYNYFDEKSCMFESLAYYTFHLDRKISMIRISYGVNNGSINLKANNIDKILFGAFTGKVITFGPDSDIINYDNKIVYINIMKETISINLIEEPIFSIEPMIYYNVVMGRDFLRNVVGPKLHRVLDSSFKPRVYKDYYVMIDGYPPVYLCSTKNESKCLTIGNKIDLVIKFIKSDEFKSIEYKNRSYKFCDIDFNCGTITLDNNLDNPEPSDPAFCHFTDLMTGELKVTYKTKEE